MYGCNICQGENNLVCGPTDSKNDTDSYYHQGHSLPYSHHTLCINRFHIQVQFGYYYRPRYFINGLIVILFVYTCKLAFLTSSTCVKVIDFSLKNDPRKAYLHVQKRIIIMPAIYERVLYLYHQELSCLAERSQDSPCLDNF